MRVGAPPRTEDPYGLSNAFQRGRGGFCGGGGSPVFGVSLFWNILKSRRPPMLPWWERSGVCLAVEQEDSIQALPPAFNGGPFASWPEKGVSFFLPVPVTVGPGSSGWSHGSPRVSLCWPVSCRDANPAVRWPPVASCVTAYLMVELPNGLPKQVVVGSNPIARSKPRSHPGTPQIDLGNGIDPQRFFCISPIVFTSLDRA